MAEEAKRLLDGFGTMIEGASAPPSEKGLDPVVAQSMTDEKIVRLLTEGSIRDRFLFSVKPRLEFELRTITGEERDHTIVLMSPENQNEPWERTNYRRQMMNLAKSIASWNGEAWPGQPPIMDAKIAMERFRKVMQMADVLSAAILNTYLEWDARVKGILMRGGLRLVENFYPSRPAGT